MGDARTMHVVAEVYESDIGLVQIGQPATISSPSLPVDMTGRVVQIGMLIFKNDVLDVDPAADADARVVEVRIELDDGERVQHLTNMTVDVVIDVASAEQGRRAAALGQAMRSRVAWRGLMHEKARSILATLGIFIAVLLIFMQLGFFNAVPRGGMMIYDRLDFDILLASSSLRLPGPVGRVSASPDPTRPAP